MRKQVTYITADGKEWLSETLALAHEKQICMVPQIEQWLKDTRGMNGEKNNYRSGVARHIAAFVNAFANDQMVSAALDAGWKLHDTPEPPAKEQAAA